LVSSLNVSGLTTLSNNTTLLLALNVSGFTTLSNNTTLVLSLNVSGFTIFNNNTTLLSLLNVSGFILGLVTSLNIGVKSPMYFTTNRFVSVSYLEIEFCIGGEIPYMTVIYSNNGNVHEKKFF
jgi:hypothetical protein